MMQCSWAWFCSEHAVYWCTDRTSGVGYTFCPRHADVVDECSDLYSHLTKPELMHVSEQAGVTSAAMRAMANALSFGHAVDYVAAVVETLGCTGPFESRIWGEPDDRAGVRGRSWPVVQTMRANIIRTKLAAIEAKRARPLGWDPEGQA